jgi:hypothetical protein
MKGEYEVRKEKEAQIGIIRIGWKQKVSERTIGHVVFLFQILEGCRFM